VNFPTVKSRDIDISQQNLILSNIPKNPIKDSSKSPVSSKTELRLAREDHDYSATQLGRNIKIPELKEERSFSDEENQKNEPQKHTGNNCNLND
jgi:hypothetical protein